MIRLHLTPSLICGLLAVTTVSSAQPPSRPASSPSIAPLRSEGSRGESAHGDGLRGDGHGEKRTAEEGRRAEGKRPFEPREHEPFFEALREVHVESANRELFELVRHDSIRQEINLSPADAEQIQSNMRQAFKAIFAVRDDNQGKPTSQEDLKQQIRDAIAPLEAESIALLRKPETNFNRLLGLYVQARSYRALMNDQVAEVIGLQGSALDDFRKSRADSWRSIMDDTRRAIEKEIRNNPPGASPRQAISQLLQQAEAKLDEQLASQLSDAQREQLQQLKGEPFPLPERLFSFPPHRGRGGPEGRGRPEDRREQGSGSK